PTNLLYNVVAIPGALWRFRRARPLGDRLTRVLVVTSLPGMVIGAVLRAEVVSGTDVFYLVIAAVLTPLGAWLALAAPAEEKRQETAPLLWVWVLALLVGIVGGIYGIGGGAILAPILIGLGFTVAEVAPATLTATFATSIAGVATFGLLSL